MSKKKRKTVYKTVFDICARKAKGRVNDFRSRIKTTWDTRQLFCPILSYDSLSRIVDRLSSLFRYYKVVFKLFSLTVYRLKKKLFAMIGNPNGLRYRLTVLPGTRVFHPGFLYGSTVLWSLTSFYGSLVISKRLVVTPCRLSFGHNRLSKFSIGPQLMTSMHVLTGLFVTFSVFFSIVIPT